MGDGVTVSGSATTIAPRTAPRTWGPADAGGYLPTLDGWRAVAILGVMLAHGTALVFDASGPVPSPLLNHLTRLGALGVNVFFGISGFLICGRLLEEETRRGRISLGGFYVRRGFRILPPCLSYLLAVALLAAIGVVSLGRVEWLSALFFFRNYYPVSPPGGWYTAHFWSLAIEEHFYLGWPLLLVLLRRRRALYAAIGLALLVTAWRAYAFRWPPSFLPGAPRTDLLLDGLLWGCVAAILFHDPRARAVLARLARPAVWWSLVATFVLVTLLRGPLHMMWQAALIPLLIVGTVLRPELAAGRALESPAAQWIGRMSYSLYLWHTLFLVGERPALVSGMHWAQTLPLSIVMTFAVAAASYYLIEKPAIRMGHRLARPASEARRT